MQHRRKFIQQVGLLAGAFSANSIFNQLQAAPFSSANQLAANLTPQQLASNEDYWSVIQQAIR
jgi:hypothetical protein